MRLAVLAVLGWLAQVGVARAGDGEWLAWPAGVYAPSGLEHMAQGPSCARPAAGGAWLYDVAGHAFLRVAGAGGVLERVPAPGFAHGLVERADGSLAYVDLARGVVTLMGRDGVVRHEVALPPGLTRVRRVVEVDGTLLLHTAFQETFRVPAQPGAPLREWFAGKREGLVFAAGLPAVQALVSRGRAELRLLVPASGPGGASAGGWSQVRVPVLAGAEVRGADVLGPAGEGGWWLRLTFAEGGKPRDALVALGPDGTLRSRSWLPEHGTLSWTDTLFVQPDGQVLGLVPTDAGVALHAWGRP